MLYSRGDSTHSCLRSTPRLIWISSESSAWIRTNEVWSLYRFLIILRYQTSCLISCNISMFVMLHFIKCLIVSNKAGIAIVIYVSTSFEDYLYIEQRLNSYLHHLGIQTVPDCCVFHITLRFFGVFFVRRVLRM